MQIRLNEIPQDGSTWNFDQNHAEMRECLTDLISNQPFTATLLIQPLGQTGTYQITGGVQTQLGEQCSRCGDDFPLLVNEKFSHLLVPALGLERDDKMVKANHYTELNESGPEAIEFRGQVFSAGDFFHELIALAEPLIPAPALTAEGKCTVCKIDVQNQTFHYDETASLKEHPFAGLKNIKLN